MSKIKVTVNSRVAGHNYIYDIETECGKKASLEYNVLAISISYINSDYIKEEINRKIHDMLGHDQFIAEINA